MECHRMRIRWVSPCAILLHQMSGMENQISQCRQWSAIDTEKSLYVLLDKLKRLGHWWRCVLSTLMAIHARKLRTTIKTMRVGWHFIGHSTAVTQCYMVEPSPPGWQLIWYFVQIHSYSFLTLVFRIIFSAPPMCITSFHSPSSEITSLPPAP